jgi:NADPH-dependent 7-cyano-7-deazaguanine reductase QueF
MKKEKLSLLKKYIMIRKDLNDNGNYKDNRILDDIIEDLTPKKTKNQLYYEHRDDDLLKD